ncbi:hypothetical protein C3489_29270 [Streptomyces sp. Ru71]|uniref:hypothetical protein n=1 Tax=Streptomyces sp. Ru71 TaxID=2080746 RepID=UPI000CDCF7BB|nr:hypothetical protein [Streptomyces sp. Ru71]POX47655.1 hypothetical protein C3489_29270 [Streptomyces sp. Ru71]
MLRITDARTGNLVEAAPVRRGLTRIEAHAPGHDAASLRVLLVTDLLVRALELGGTPVWALLAGHRERAELRASAAALGIRPLEEAHDAVTGGLGEAQVVHVVGEGGIAVEERGTVAGDGGTAPDGVRLAVGPVILADGDPGDRDPEVGAPEGVVAEDVDLLDQDRAGGLRVPGLPAGADPAAVRLALLSAPRTAPVRLDPQTLAVAHGTLTRWRRAVAGWACRPSRPVPDEVRTALRTAWEDDLDMPAVLDVLRRVEDAGPELPEGARFETYVYADRLLALDLARDLGSAP